MLRGCGRVEGISALRGGGDARRAGPSTPKARRIGHGCGPTLARAVPRPAAAVPTTAGSAPLTPRPKTSPTARPLAGDRPGPSPAPAICSSVTAPTGPDIDGRSATPGRAAGGEAGAGRRVRERRRGSEGEAMIKNSPLQDNAGRLRRVGQCDSAERGTANLSLLFDGRFEASKRC